VAADPVANPLSLHDTDSLSDTYPHGHCDVHRIRDAYG
jgi:hypothetical protein